MVLIPNLTEHFVLPFLFTLAIVFGILRATNVFSGNKAVEMIIAFVFAYFSATYEPFVKMFFRYLPGLTEFFIGVFLLIFVIEAFGLRKATQQDKKTNMIIYGILLMFLMMFSGFFASKIGPLPYIGNPEGLFILIGIVLIVALFKTASEA